MGEGSRIESAVGQPPEEGVGHDLGLIFVLPFDRWDGTAGAEAHNHAFIDAFVATHPDYARVFRFLVARAMKPDNSGGFGTVYNAQTGYSISPSP